MRNLEILNKLHIKLELNNETVKSACLDEYGKLIFVFTDSLNLYSFAYNQDGSANLLQEVKSLNDAVSFEDQDPLIAEADLVQMDYIQELEGVVLTFSSGTIYLYSKNTQKIDEVGVLADGILTASWAPNEEFFLVAGKNSKLLVFTPEFDVLHEVDIDDGDSTFHDIKNKDQITDEQKQVTDAQISWRSDSTVFVCNYGINGGHKCLTRELSSGEMRVTKGPARADFQSVFSVSERSITDLQLPLCFMPSGSLVAGFSKKKLPSGDLQNQITFWERNGLNHGEFVLPDSVQEVKSLHFNIDSTLFAVHCEVMNKETNQTSQQVLIFTRSNWKWTCKQMIQMEKGSVNFSKVHWLNTQTGQMFTVSKNGLLQFTEFNFAYHTSMSNLNQKNKQGDEDLAYTAVVDYDNINLTPLGKFVMPPPMFEKQVKLGAFPSHLSLFGHSAAVLCATKAMIKIFDCMNHQKVSSIQLKPDDFKYNMDMVTKFIYYSTSNGTFVAMVISEQVKDHLVIIELNLNENTYKLVGNEIILDNKVYSLCLSSSLHHKGQFKENKFASDNSYYIDNSGDNEGGYLSSQMMMFGLDQNNDDNENHFLFVQTFDKEVLKINLQDLTAEPSPVLTMNQLCFKIQTAMLSGKEVVIALTQNQRLFINGRLFCNECTGFLMSQNFLLFTASTVGLSHKLYIYDLNKALPKPLTATLGNDQQQALPELASVEDSGDFRVRACERGSRLVIAKGFKVVLQMPRGNLEGINPRIMLLQEVIQLIEEMQYGKAFRLIRQHKLDMNLLYDVAPEQFIENISKFVNELSKNIDFLNLFINSLDNSPRGKELEFMRPQSQEDLIKLKHEKFMKVQIKGDKSNTFEKVNCICDAVRAELEKQNENNKFLLPILTTYVKKQPQELKQVLSLIQTMNKNEK